MPLFDKNKPGISKNSFLNAFKKLKNPRPMSSRLSPRTKEKMGKEILSDRHIKGSYVDSQELTNIKKELEHRTFTTHDPIKKNELKDKIKMIEELKKK